MTSRKLRVLLFLAAVAALLGVVWYLSGGRTSTEPAVVPSETSAIAPLPAAPAPRVQGLAARDFREPGRPALGAVTSSPPMNPDDRSPLADSLHARGQTGMQDLAVVLGLFTHYREKLGGLPVGESNAQIVNALTGNNPLGLALLERSHPAINPAGELTDRWGTALFFHLVSREALEIRSAGEDKEMWTGDDHLTQSPSLRAAPPLP